MRTDESFKDRQMRWGAMQSINREETNRLAILNGPTPRNPEHLMKLVKLKSLGGFSINGAEALAGSIVQTEWHVARDVIAQGKATLINE